MPSATTTVKVKVKPDISVGVGTIAGFAFSLLGVLGTLGAAIAANDTATIVSGIGAALVAVTTLGGRFAQAVVAARAVAKAFLPIVAAVAEDPDPPPAAG